MIIDKCECYDFQLLAWKEISNMNIKRYSGYSLVHASNIYVFGGFTDQNKRKRAIEKYD